MFIKESAAFVYIFFNILIIIFHFALILGAPWGEFTMGGKDVGKLPKQKRVFAVLALPLLIFFLITIISLSGLSFIELKPISSKTIWGVIFFNFLTAIGNIFTKSHQERKLWAPITLIMLVCAIIIAV